MTKFHPNAGQSIWKTHPVARFVEPALENIPLLMVVLHFWRIASQTALSMILYIYQYTNRWISDNFEKMLLIDLCAKLIKCSNFSK